MPAIRCFPSAARREPVWNPPDARNPLREFYWMRGLRCAAGASLRRPAKRGISACPTPVGARCHSPTFSPATSFAQPLAEWVADATVRRCARASDRHAHLNRPGSGDSCKRREPRRPAARRERGAPPTCCWRIGDGLPSAARRKAPVPLDSASFLPPQHSANPRPESPASVVLAHLSRSAPWRCHRLVETPKARAVAILIGERPGSSAGQPSECV